MIDESSYTNLQTAWNSDRYYEVGLMGFVLGLTYNMYLFHNIAVLGVGFLGPCILFITVLGIPMVILELTLSQYGQAGMIRIWDLCPIFKSMGYLCLLYVFVVLVEGLGMLAYLGRYLLNSFSTTSGWDSCNNDWNTDYCFTAETNVSRRLDCYDLYGKIECDETTWESSHFQYWSLVVQNIDLGMFQWKSVAYCFGVALIAFALTFRGIMMVEKVVFWSLIIVAVEFIILLYCSIIQRGSGLGIGFLFRWNSNMFKKDAWAVSFKYFINSTALGTGGLRTLGSQNRFRGHSYMNAMMLILVNVMVTLLYTILYLCLCGNLSYFSNQSMEEIMADEEPEFWSKIPRMLQRLDGPNRLWTCIFYCQLFLMGFAKCVITTFVIVKTLFERYPRIENYYMMTSGIVYLCAFVCSIATFTKIGSFLLEQVFWNSLRGPMILLMNLLQTTVILYIYGLTTVVDDLHFMLGFRLAFYWQVILLLTPLILCVLLVLQLLWFYENKEIQLVTEKLMMNVVAYLPIFTTIGYSIYFMRWIIWKCRWENVFMPSDSWYLSDPILRKSRQMFSAMSMTKEYLYRQTKRQAKTAYDMDESAYEEEAA